MGSKSRNLTNATEEANRIILLRLGETVASSMKKLHRFKKLKKTLDFGAYEAI